MGKPGKWRLERKESFVHKLTKEHKYRPFSKFEKGAILLILATAGFFVISFGYYTNNVAPYQIGNPSNLKRDPYNPIWNGTITSTLGKSLASSGNPTFVQSIAGSQAGVSNVNILVGEFVGAKVTTTFLSNWTGWCSISDDAGNTWHIMNQNTGTDIVAWSSITIPFTNDRVLFHPCGGGQPTGASMVQIYKFVTVGATNEQEPNTQGDTISLTTTDTNSIIWQSFQGIHTAAFSSSQTLRGSTVNGATQFDSIDGDKPCSNTTCSLSTTAGGSAIQVNAVVELKPGTTTSSFCPFGYQCLNSQVDANKDIQLNANSTFAGEMLTNSTVDLSLLASKQALFWENWKNSSVITQPFGWYFTLNSTLPLTPNYNPLLDQSVVMAVIAFPVTQDAYVFIQRQPGQRFLPASGLPADSFPTCPPNSVLYSCVHFNNLGGGFKALMLSLNFTGPQAGVQNSGLNYLCYNTSFTSNLFTFGSNVLNQSYCSNTNTLPWLNVQSQYYVGFWSSASQPASVTFGSSIGKDGTGNGFDEMANAIFYWIPNPSASNTPTTEGGFFGWIGRSVSGVFNQVGGFLSPVTNMLFGFGNSLLSVFISGMAQGFQVFLTAFVLVLNFIGTKLGLGNLGDLILSLLAIVGTLITQGLSTIVSIFTAIGNFLTSGWLTFIAGAALAIPALISLGLVIWNFIFNGNFSVKTILYIDGLICGMAIYKKGLKGFFAWISLNVFLFTFVFNMAWTVFDILTRPIHRTKETVDPVG